MWVTGSLSYILVFLSVGVTGNAISGASKIVGNLGMGGSDIV